MFDPVTTKTIMVYLLLTLVLGGGAAFLAGRALAIGWRPRLYAVLYMIPMAAAVRFLDFALFQGPLDGIGHFLIDLATLTGMTLLGYQLKRARQMVKQYPWLYVSAGPFSWRNRA